jgi:hypothetical protein
MELVDQLVKNLGVSEEAAKGGSGLIFNMAKEKLGAGDFGKVASALPGITDLMKSAPESGGVLGGIGKLASGFGGGAKAEMWLNPYCKRRLNRFHKRKGRPTPIIFSSVGLPQFFGRKDSHERTLRKGEAHSAAARGLGG